jgi:endonuclease/exonuclease/phosphatase family metal-dependent hydrolase
VAWLVRTWNVFHGNTVPPGRRAHLEEMVRLAVADGPTIVCLQEVPVWAVRRLARWSGMTAIGAVAAHPRLRSAELGRIVTDIDHGLLRSAFTGQANAILVGAGLDVAGEAAEQISTSGERRVCQAVTIDGLGVVANVHVTGGAPAEEQLRRAVRFAEDAAGDKPLILCGDFNLTPPYEAIDGYSTPARGIDQVLVRGLPAAPPLVWPPERRRLEARLLSDHAPVDVLVG